ncbi:DNA-binding transcriptional LysR family regulator [Hasllibacter halocynthiae]|uniref:DNA-binding transcriptional LysR family regulator n=1 Tax=Hasllibacter halocynthiae TaxID=595589 RepID=A0A2T0X833_9RHOB|nr:LysR family transcriptional regulator [Hasllibacter halocynthiae]PRY95111.1 DNA-binding transcriptional LysR family regulator [Hasllibacter halocynthiae]
MTPKDDGRGSAMDNWDDMKFMLALSRRGTMTAAARSLGTNVATVSRRIERLTESAATPLFVKTGGSWRATQVAQGLIRAAEEFEAQVAREENNARQTVGRGLSPIRLAASPVIISSILLPHIGTLVATHPNLRLSLRNKVQSTGLGEADLFIRFGRPEAGRLIARRVGSVSFHPYVPRGRRGPAGGWVGLSSEYDDAPSAVLGHSIYEGDPTVRCDQFEHMVGAMKSTGLPGVIPDIVGARDADLEKVENGGGAVELEFWLAFHQSRRDDMAVRATADWVIECFRSTAWANVQDEIEIAAQ